MNNPFGLHTVTPYMTAKNVKDVIVFMQHIFGAKLRDGTEYREDGTIKHAEISIDDCVVMIGNPTNDNEITPTSLYIYVPNCEETYNKAIAYGAAAISEPRLYPHGDKFGGIKDDEGNVYWVVTHQE